MPLQAFTYVGAEGAEISAFVSRPSTAPKGIVQIAHGMAEHAQRYAHFAEFLNQAGFVVYANDHRGHGTTVNHGKAGYFADHNGWQVVVEDMRCLTQLAQSEYPRLPTFLLGHSMGSLLGRSYAQRYGKNLAGLILISTTITSPALLVGAKTAAHVECFLRGSTEPSQFLHNLTFGPFIRSVSPHRTAFDWLSRDPHVVDDYIADPWCGNVFTAGFYKDLATGIEDISGPHAAKTIPQGLPILLLAGTCDPMSHLGRDVDRYATLLKGAGLRNITQRLYEGARHELLNETNREEVYRDVLQWNQNTTGMERNT